jgi:hypothetical protein
MTSNVFIPSSRNAEVEDFAFFQNSVGTLVLVGNSTQLNICLLLLKKMYTE